MRVALLMFVAASALALMVTDSTLGVPGGAPQAPATQPRDDLRGLAWPTARSYKARGDDFRIRMSSRRADGKLILETKLPFGIEADIGANEFMEVWSNDHPPQLVRVTKSSPGCGPFDVDYDIEFRKGRGRIETGDPRKPRILALPRGVMTWNLLFCRLGQMARENVAELRFTRMLTPDLELESGDFELRRVGREKLRRDTEDVDVVRYSLRGPETPCEFWVDNHGVVRQFGDDECLCDLESEGANPPRAEAAAETSEIFARPR